VDFRFVPPDLRKLDVDGVELIACGAYSDERPMHGLAGLLDWRMAGKLSALAKADFLRAELGEVLLVPGRPRLPFDKVLVLGLGARAAFGEPALQRAVERLSQTLEGLHVRRAVVELPGRADDRIPPERAVELVLERVGDSAAHDAWWLVEEPEGQRRVEQRVHGDRRRAAPG